MIGDIRSDLQAAAFPVFPISASKILRCRRSLSRPLFPGPGNQRGKTVRSELAIAYGVSDYDLMILAPVRSFGILRQRRQM